MSLKGPNIYPMGGPWTGVSRELITEGKPQRVYRGGTQYHDHPPFGDRHTQPKVHDGYWRHYHDDGGMVAAEETALPQWEKDLLDRQAVADEMQDIAARLISLSNILNREGGDD